MPQPTKNTFWAARSKFGARRGYDSGPSRRWYARIHSALLDAGDRDGLQPHDVLDCGCGTGQLLLEAARRYPHARLAGIDLAEEMIGVARSKFHLDAVDFRVGSADELPFHDASFDFVMSTASMQHWPDDLAGLREIHRVLQPGGAFLLSVPVTRGPWDWRGWPLIVSSWFKAIHHVYTEAELRRKIDAAGFRLAKDETMPWGPLTMTIWILHPSIDRTQTDTRR